MYKPIKLEPPIRMFEAFSGIGTQAMALKRITDDYEIVGYSEIDKHSIKSYQTIHGEHIKNYGDITKMEYIPLCDIFTWSFPCTDLSKAGKRTGMTKDSRSGLVYDVIRLLHATKDKPKVLIMENVPDLVQEKFYMQFREIRLKLEKLGYMNYLELMNAKDYGIAQNRNRAFMVSILGEYSYEFPKKVTLEKRLQDYLEVDVDDKYYLSDKVLNYFNGTSKKFDRSERFKPKDITSTYASTILTKAGNSVFENYLKILGGNGAVTKDMRVRKLTPLECWRLMDISDENFHKAQCVCSNSQLYKQAGNAIVVGVFEAILRQMIEV